MARKKKNAIRSITAPRKAHLNKLAGILYEFLPLSSISSNAVTFRSIFRGSKIDHYLPEGNKRQALQSAFTELYRRHDRLPKQIIRRIIPAAIEWRQYKRRPLTRRELDDLSSCLLDLGIDMSKEISATTVDESLPRIAVPPEKLKERLREHDLHPQIASDPLQLFENGHFNESVRKALERYEDTVKRLSGNSAIGRDLMAKSFKTDTLLDVSKLKPDNQVTFTDGYMLMTMGTMAAIRNIFSHGDEERRDPEECFEMLLFVNWLFRALK